ncbi:hypothetical protein PAMP_018812 [Pampus punctatissimus]
MRVRQGSGAAASNKKTSGGQAPLNRASDLVSTQHHIAVGDGSQKSDGEIVYKIKIKKSFFNVSLCPLPQIPFMAQLVLSSEINKTSQLSLGLRAAFKN